MAYFTLIISARVKGKHISVNDHMEFINKIPFSVQRLVETEFKVEVISELLQDVSNLLSLRNS
jgi:hypothetical protein